MKLKKPLIIIGIIVIIITAIGGYFLFKGPPKVDMVTTVVKRGTLIQTVETTGELESLDKVELAFGTNGTVENILVEVGSEVKAGDVLATLNLAKLSANVESVQQAVEIARANLAQKKAGSSDEVVKVYEFQVTSAQAVLAAAKVSLASAQTTGQATVAEAEVSLNNAQEDLENTQINNEENLVEAYEDLVQVLKNNLIIVRGALSDADEVLGINNTMANNDFEDILSANDYQALVSAENYYRAGIFSRDRAEDVVFAFASVVQASDIETATALVKTALADSASALLYTRRALDATNVDNASFSSSDLSVLKASIDSARNSVQTEEEALSAQLQTVSQLKITNASSLDNVENLVNKYEKVLVSAQISRDSSVASAQATVTMREADLIIAQANFEQIKAQPRAVDLSALTAAVSQAEANYWQIQAGLTEAKIIAPIDGRVTVVNIERGEEVSLASSVITVQTTTTKFQITADVSEADISKVSLDDAVKITFDAFGDDREFTGLVKKIDPAEKNIDGVIYYKVTVYLDDFSTSSDWKPGMTADVTITTAKIDNVILVPQRAVLEYPDGVKYVRLPEGSSFKEQIVSTGIRGNDGLLEIISGLSEDQTIIVSIRD